jgi:hypothetical protein
MIMNEDLDHMMDESIGKKIVKLHNKHISIEDIAKEFKRDEWEIVFCLRHMAVIMGYKVRPIGFRYKRVKEGKG